MNNGNQAPVEDQVPEEGEPDAPEPYDELAPEDEELARFLSEGMTQEAAADAVGLTARTVRRRLQHPQFRARVGELRRERLTATTARLVRMSDTATDTLEELLGSENENLRFRAAQAVLAMGRRHHKEEVIEFDLAARMEAIEALLDGVEEEIK